MPDHIDRAAEVLEVHEVVFIDHEVGYECGCNEHGDGHPDGLPFLTDALKHQVRALDAAGLLASPEHDAEVAARTLRKLADETSERHASSLFTGGADRPYGWGAVSTLLREEADRIEREAGVGGEVDPTKSL